MLTVSIAPSLSDVRLEKVLAAIRDRVAHVESVDTRYIHLVEVSAPLADEQHTVAPGDVVLVKGSRLMKMERVVAGIIEEDHNGGKA